MENISYEAHKEEMDRLKYAHEGESAMLEIANKRAYILSIILLIALVLTNAGWLYYESQFEESTTLTQTVSSDSVGDVAINGIGDLNYGGQSDTDNN